MQKTFQKHAIGAVSMALAVAMSLGSADAGSRMAVHPLLTHFADIDTDSSGTLTREELAASAQARFVAADSNADAQLDLSELEAAISARAAARQANAPEGAPVRRLDAARIAWIVQGVFLHRDKDGDALLSWAEMQPRPERVTRLLARLDGDGDGALSREELMAARPAHGAPAAAGQE